MHYVIVGNGVGGFEAARVLRARAPDARVTLVSEESAHFFARTALVWVLTGQLSRRDIEPHERAAVEALRLEIVRGRATRLDVADKRLIVEPGGRALSYDRLLLACGSRPRPWEVPVASAPAGVPPGVGHFVTLQDLEWLAHELHGDGSDEEEDEVLRRLVSSDGATTSPYRRRPSARSLRGGAPPRAPVVVGAGLIGLEVAEAFVAAGCSPTILHRPGRGLPAVLDAREAEFLSRRSHGVRFCDAAVETIEAGERGVTGLHTSDGRVPADLLVVTIGVQPHTEWLAGTLALDEHGGVVVDDALRASVADVYAAGDCASILRPEGGRGPIPTWYAARDQGRVAAGAMLGDRVSYRPGVRWDTAKIFDMELTTVGDVEDVNSSGAPRETFFHEETGRVASTLRFVFERGALVGASLLGRRWDHGVFVELVREGAPLRRVLERLDEAAFDEEFVPRLALPPQVTRVASSIRTGSLRR